MRNAIRTMNIITRTKLSASGVQTITGMLAVLSFPSGAFAAAEAVHASSLNDFFSSLPLMLAMAVAFYFLLIRPQAKQAKEKQALLDALSTGDEVALAGGIVGEIKKVDTSLIVLNIAKGVDIVAQKHHVSTVLPKGTYRCV